MFVRTENMICGWGDSNPRDWKKLYILLGSILSIALVLRFYGIWNSEHGDEINEIFEALRVCSGHFNYNRWFKRFFLYILSFEYGLYYLVGKAIGLFTSPLQFAEQVVSNMKPLFLIGRMTNVVFGTFSIYLLYALGKKIANTYVGLLAALFFTFSLLHIKSSHYATVDVSMVMLLLLSTIFLTNILAQQTNKRDYFLFAFFAGLATQAKLPAIVILFPFFSALVFNAFFQKRHDYKSLSPLVLIASLAFALGLILGNPPVIFRPVPFLKALFHFTTSITKKSTVYVNVPDGWTFYFKTILSDLGVFATIMSLGGIIISFTKKNYYSIIMLSFLIPFYVIISSSRQLVFARYILPIVPFLCLYVSIFVYYLLTKPAFSRISFLPLLLILLPICFPLYKVLEYDISLTGQNTRYLAGKWVEANITPGSKILLESGKSINSSSVVISESETNIRDKITRIDQVLSQGKEFYDYVGMVDGNALIYYELQLKTLPKIVYDITSAEFNTNIKTYDYYIGKRYEYAIIKSDTQDLYLSRIGAQSRPHLHKFYTDLATRGELIKTFEPDWLHRGARFRIFKFH